MGNASVISDYLTEVLKDWRASRTSYPKNTHPKDQWPIPFFGNPRTALVATVGVNPSPEEFRCGRQWNQVQKVTDWKTRLRDYFKCSTPPHEWFEPWRTGLALLDVSYEKGTAAHFDVSYRSTKAMLKNKVTDKAEFRCMVENDVKWLFRLLPLCPNLRLLLTMGPIIGSKGQNETLFSFLFDAASKHGFKAIKNEGAWQLWRDGSKQVLILHEADTPEEECITCRVVKNLLEHRQFLRGWLR